MKSWEKYVIISYTQPNPRYSAKNNVAMRMIATLKFFIYFGINLAIIRKATFQAISKMSDSREKRKEIKKKVRAIR